MSTLLEELRSAPVVAILRRPRVEVEVCVRVLVEAGIRFIEVTIDSPGCLPFLETSAGNFKGAVFGAGTVTVPELAEKAIRAGATGYLLREASALEVMGAIRAVSQGEAICPPRLCRALFKIAAQAEPVIPSIRVRMNLGLTRRQQELVPLIARGLTNKEIASHLNLSEQTIKNHIHRMLRKVGADDRTEVVEIAGVRDAAV